MAKFAWLGALLLLLVCGIVLIGYQGARVRDVSLTPSDSPAVPDPIRGRNSFVGSQACAECHSEIARRYQSHPMARSTRLIAKESAIEEPAGVVEFSTRPDRRYKVEALGEKMVHHELGIGRKDTVVYDQAEEISFSIGSGARGRSYAHAKGGLVFFSPISWYSKSKRWDLSPGYSPSGHQRFERPAPARCLLCHAGALDQPEKQTTGAYQRYGEKIIVEEAISCERCHGAGAEHVRLRQSGQSKNDPIVNPSKLEPARRESVCNQCHLQGKGIVLRSGKGFDDFRPGDHLGDVWSVFVLGDGVTAEEDTRAVSHVEQMNSSVCAQKSEGRLGCISCHDPHETPAATDVETYYRSRCLTCHAEQGCSAGEDVRKTKEDSCTACHMPRLSASDVPHTTQTDHRILRTSGSGPSRGASKTKNSEQNWTIFDIQDCPIPTADATRARALILAEYYGGIGAAEKARTILPSLERSAEAFPNDAEIQDRLGLVYALMGRGDDAEKAWLRSISLDPSRIEVLYTLGSLYQKVGEHEEAIQQFEKYLQANPWSSEIQARLSMSLRQVGKINESIEAAEKSLRVDPSSARTNFWLADLYRAAGRANDSAGAKSRAESLRP